MTSSKETASNNATALDAAMTLLFRALRLCRRASERHRWAQLQDFADP